MRTTIVNPYKKGKKTMKAKRRVMRRKTVIRRTSRRKANPRRGARKTYRVAGETLYRQRPVFYSRDGVRAKKKLGQRSPRKKLNPRKGVYAMKRKRRSVRRRKSNPFSMKKRGRRRVRRNPMSGMGGQILQALLGGLVTSGSMVGGLYIGQMVANMIAGSGTAAPDLAKKAQHRNLTRAGLTLLSAVLLPKFAPKFSDAVTSGLFTATVLGFMNTSFGINLGELAGEGSGGLLYGGPSFNLSERLQLGGSRWENPDYSSISGVSDLGGDPSGDDF